MNINEIDIDECQTNNGGCDVNSDCTNTIGSFTCVCNEGYSGDGITCNLASAEKNQSEQAIGIGVGVTVGLLALILLVLLVLFFIRRNVIVFFFLKKTQVHFLFFIFYFLF